MDAGLFERSLLHPPKLSTVLRELHPQAADFFKDIYSLEFLGLPAEHDEADLHRSLLRNLGLFITELGRDFCFIGSEHPLQVGGQDFALDLLFFHRGLNCLIAIELKVRTFRPEDLGKLNFYLEALDRDHRKTHENPSIGLLLCATKDEEVVEYALSPTLSSFLLPPSSFLEALRGAPRRSEALMKLTKRGEYALRALIDMVLSREAGRQLIPLKSLVSDADYQS